MRFTISVLLIYSLSTPLYGVNAGGIIDNIINHADTIKKATSVIANLGLNCATDHVNYALFQDELKKLKIGLARLIAETGLQLALKKDYPTICHVLTKSHLKDTFSDPSKSSSRKKCLGEDWFGTCILEETITVKRPQPTYYWPTYFIEVTENGNSLHPTFAKNNSLFELNRKIAGKFPVKTNGVINLSGFVFGNSIVKAAFSKAGIKGPIINFADLAKLIGLMPLEQKRIRASKAKTQSSYDVNIWPVALSELMAEHFTVCGPLLKDMGKHPGGYSWAAKGVPTTCPVAMSIDAMHYWDTGLLDYLDPVALSKMVIGSNPLTCGAAALSQIGSLGSASGEKAVSEEKVKNETSGLSDKLKRGIQTCSWPITGVTEAVIKKTINVANPAKWSGPYCTFWGSLAPRMSSSVYNNDYSFANAALKFKLLAHEMFGVPRGKSERWSLAHPWEGKGALINRSKYPFFSDLKASVDSVLEKTKMNSHHASRSETLFIPGDPKLIDISFSTKLVGDLINSTAANRRIYTVWEKISCPSISAKVTIERAGFSISKYESCKSAIRYEVYKFIQTELIRIICDALGQKEGLPWL